MDLAQPEGVRPSFYQPVTGPKERYSSDNHKDCQCYLEHLLLQEDFDHLSNLLREAVWQRFSLLEDEHMHADRTPENSVDQMSECELADPLRQSFQESSLDLGCDKENVGSMLSRCSSDVLNETEKNVELMDSLDWKFHLDTVARNYPLTEDCFVGTSHILFSPWFVLSAVFTGCPKLLQYLLSSCEKNVKEYQRNNELNGNVTKEKLHKIVGHCLEGTSDVSQSVSVSTPFCDRSIKHLQPIHINVDHSGSLAGNLCQKLSSYPQTVQQFVNRKMACEFPITDTWIHQSVNLMVSPLHLACWRHDFSSIMLLLQHGADPNELALEQAPDEFKNELIHGGAAHSSAAQQGFFRLYNDLYFYKDRGLSPLHFIALGLRSPPRHSVLEGCKTGIMHDTCALFLEHKRRESSDGNDGNLPSTVLFSHLHTRDYSNIACVMLTPSGQSSLEEQCETAAKCELVANCLEVLLQAGANPNLGQNLILKGAYPLDIVLQPPTKVYYAPSAARGNQSSVSLRLQDLEHSSSQVVAACRTLLCHDAELSSVFLSAYMWRPELLDCFHLIDAHNCLQLVGFLIRLGVFSDRFSHGNRHHMEASACSISVFTSAIIHRFIADILNSSISSSLTYLIFSWCSMTMLHNIIKTVAKIAEMSGWNDKLKDLSDMAVSLQMRSLKHCCYCVILARVRYSYSAVWSLPLPARLKRELTGLCV